MMVSISIRDLTKKFGSITALDGVTLGVEEPMVLGILGPNGAGKTTMLKIITGILRPTSGAVTINGTSIRNDPRKVLSSIGSLIEEPQFYPYITGYESLRFVSRIRGLSARDTENEIDRVSDITSIGKYLHRQTGHYSRGMRQRLGIAAAMISDPEILILDEPTTGLDPKGMKEIRDIIRNISSSGEHIVVLSTHLLNEAREVCDRVAIINRGTVAYDSSGLSSGTTVTVHVNGEAPEIKLNSSRISDYSVEGNRIVIRKGDGVQNHEVIRELIDRGIKVEEVSNYDDLENTYISIVGDEK